MNMADQDLTAKRNRYSAEDRPTPGPEIEGQGRTRIEVSLTAQGQDLVVRIGGGVTHVGAVAVFAPCTEEPGVPARGRDHAELAVVPGHKEGPLAAAAAERLGRAAGRPCVVIAGIHQDGATSEEIAAIVANVQRAVARLAGRLQRRQDNGKS